MIDLSTAHNQIRCAASFKDLVATPFSGEMNAICWRRNLNGNFAEIVDKIELYGNISEIEQKQLHRLVLSEQGQIAREVLLNDWQMLIEHGASPTLNVIRCYERDNAYPFFPTDVYSFHVDRSPVPTDTFLCTYYGEPSEILPNSHGEQKVLIPEIREELKKQYVGPEDGFETFLSEHFFDLHYKAKPSADIISLGAGNLWRLAVDYPQSPALPCIHRAPKEKPGQCRLLMIC